MKSSKIFRKSEDLYKYIEDLNVIFRSEIQIREIQSKNCIANFESDTMYNVMK